MMQEIFNFRAGLTPGKTNFLGQASVETGAELARPKALCYEGETPSPSTAA